MIKVLKKLQQDKKISPPPWLIDNLLYLNVHGSELYGCNLSNSDKDIYGICIPPRELVFPHEYGYIYGYDEPPKFESWQQHHVDEYDFQVFSIARFMRLAVDGNPNVTECLFAPHDCILHRSELIQPILDIRTEFLSKKSVPKFRGYMLSQLTKMKSSTKEGGRKEVVDKFGYDIKNASHCIRLAYYCEQILMDRWIDLRRDSALLKSIKRGEFKLKEILDLAHSIILRIDKLLTNSSIPDHPNYELIKQKLADLLGSHYGAKIDLPNSAQEKLDQIRALLL